MSASNSLTSPAIESFEDELDAHIEESKSDPEFRAASLDVDLRVELIECLVSLRKRAGLTQGEVAARMGVRQSTVSGFETEGSDPRLSTIQRYARAVEAECRVMVDFPKRLEWVAPLRDLERVNAISAVSVRFSVASDRSRAWVRAADSRRDDFALAG